MALAKQHDGVIINADSQQIYKGLPILSAQPDADDMSEVPHRLYNFLDGADICDAHRWRELAKKELDDVLSKGKLPILVGGTGLYINALVDGLSPVPDIPEDVRAETMQLLDEIGIKEFYKRLKGRDTKMAARLDPTNKRRIARAWEVIEATGKSLAEWQKMPREGAPENIRFYMIKVMPDREALRERCNKRFDQMMDNGAFEEIKALNERVRAGELDDLSPITKALGFRAFKAYLESLVKWQEATDMAKAETRQYAKRQITWFRHQVPENIISVITWNPDTDPLPDIERKDAI